MSSRAATASSAQGRPSKRQASVRAWAATCSFDLRLGQVCRCASRRMSRCASRRKPSTAEKSRTIRIVSARHAARPHSASILDLALPHYRTAPGRIPATNRAAWYPTPHSCATSDTNESLHPEIELRNAAINQPGNQSATTKQQQLASRSGNRRSRTHAISGIKHDLQWIGSARAPSA